MTDSRLDNVDVHDAGHRIVLSCDDGEHLHAVMANLRSEGAEKVQMPIRVGKRWVASFENPALKKCTVESFGYQILVSGPERDVVFARSQQFRERGAQIVRGPVKEGRVWRIYLEELDLYEAPRFAVQDAARRAP